MKIRQHDSVYFIALEPGESVRKMLEDFAERHKIGAGIIMHGIGAVEKIDLGYYNLKERKYEAVPVYNEDGYELISLQGNLTHKDGKPFLHAHVGLGDSRGQMVGGHMNDMRALVTVELAIQVFPGVRVDRKLDERVGLPVWNFEQHCGT